MESRSDLVSVIVPVTERAAQVNETILAYKEEMDVLGRPYELICIIDGDEPVSTSALDVLRRNGPPIRIVKLAKRYGESVALTAGFRESRGSVIVTLPAYQQTDPHEISRLIDALGDHDMVVARRWPRNDPKVNIVQAWCFNKIVQVLAGCPFDDLGCAVRVFRREVAQEVSIYGDQHRFFPLMAHARGFSVIQLNARQVRSDAFLRMYRPGLYVRRLLDVLAIYFLLKFTYKPLRFFGLIGIGIFGGGGAIMAYLFVDRVFFSVALSDRPLLLVASLAVVLGIQILAIGLIGELIIFVNRRSLQSYRIVEILDHESMTGDILGK